MKTKQEKEIATLKGEIAQLKARLAMYEIDLSPYQAALIDSRPYLTAACGKRASGMGPHETLLSECTGKRTNGLPFSGPGVFTVADREKAAREKLSAFACIADNALRAKVRQALGMNTELTVPEQNSVNHAPASTGYVPKYKW